ncbi:MAG: prepilin-type N-terminal cleavage/methylation domain-containing protein [Candidatus Binatia bacterium]|nr:prepilin-type N-terminal cleavage/methylation domain-containing protein [Candidatus Binatia bacterium]
MNRKLSQQEVHLSLPILACPVVHEEIPPRCVLPPFGTGETSGGIASMAVRPGSPVGDKASSAVCPPPQERRKAWGLSPLLSQAAFTLLEVMVALAILALGLVAVLELFAGSLRLGSKASRHTQAAIYAQNEMNRLFAQPALAEGAEGGELPHGYSWRARVYEVRPDDTPSQPSARQQDPTDLFHLYAIEVEVSWQDDGTQHTVTLRSLRTIAEEQGDG